jgi:16S rRNA (cytosine967-C5)-methyltransferase
MTPRDLACAALGGPDQVPGFSERYLDKEFRKKKDLSQRDKALAVHLVQGVLRWRLRLDWIIEQASRFPFKKIEQPILNILRLALYQIFFMDRIPDSAAVNEAVKQTRFLGHAHLTRFVNGILREICRRKEALSFPDRTEDSVSYFSVFHSYPPWLVEKWIGELGVKDAESLMVEGNRIPGMVIRANRHKTDVRTLMRGLEKEGVECRPTAVVPGALRIENPGRSIAQLSAFKDGLFQVQGEAAQVCSILLSPGPEETVLDLCSGLGGKAFHMAEMAGEEARITALDTSHGRLISLSENAQRLGIGCIDPVTADAVTALPFGRDCGFDRIMVDAPCSALGTISRHPDAKWSRKAEDIERLAGIQAAILSGACPLLKKGGKLLYATCTISREENEMVVHGFLERHPGMEVVDLRRVVPDWGKGLINEEGFLKTFPHVHDMDGFFGALFVKKEIS